MKSSNMKSAIQREKLEKALEWSVNGAGKFQLSEGEEHLGVIEKEEAEIIAKHIRNKKITKVVISNMFTADGLEIVLNALNSNSKNIIEFEVDRCCFFDKGTAKQLGEFLNTLPRLKSLELYAVTHENFADICEAIKSHPSLENLIFSESINKPAVDGVLSGPMFKNIGLLQLTKLTIVGSLTDEMVKELFGPGNKLKTKSLEIMDTSGLTPQGAKMIGQHIQVEELKFCCESSKGKQYNIDRFCAILEGFKESTTLKVLDLSKNQYIANSPKVSTSLTEFFEFNKSVKTLLLNKIEGIPGFQLNQNTSLETLSMNWQPAGDEDIWDNTINGSKLREVFFSSGGGVPKTAKAIVSHTKTLETVTLGESLYNPVDAELKKNTEFRSKLQAVAEGMKKNFESLGVKDFGDVNLSLVKKEDFYKITNIPFLHKVINANSVLFLRLLGDNKWVKFLENYKNDNGWVLTNVHKSDKFEPWTTENNAGVSPLVNLSQEIWSKIFSYLSTEDMYKIATSKVEEVTISGKDNVETE